jgi:hypothetical protein
MTYSTNKPGRQPTQDGADDFTVIVAKFAGRCTACTLGFARGDRIRWRRGHAAHLDCRSAAAEHAARFDEVIEAASGGRRR